MNLSGAWDPAKPDYENKGKGDKIILTSFKTAPLWQAQYQVTTIFKSMPYAPFTSHKQFSFMSLVQTIPAASILLKNPKPSLFFEKIIILDIIEESWEHSSPK